MDPIDHDFAFLDPAEVDALVARVTAYCDHAGIAPPTPERARELIRGWDRLIASNVEPWRVH